MNVKIAWICRMNACVHRLDLGLYSHRKEFWGNGIRTHANSKGKIPSTGKKSPQRKIEPTTLHQAEQRAQHTSNWAIPAPISTVNPSICQSILLPHQYYYFYYPSIHLAIHTTATPILLFLQAVPTYQFISLSHIFLLAIHPLIIPYYCHTQHNCFLPASHQSTYCFILLPNVIRLFLLAIHTTAVPIPLFVRSSQPLISTSHPSSIHAIAARDTIISTGHPSTYQSILLPHIIQLFQLAFHPLISSCYCHT